MRIKLSAELKEQVWNYVKENDLGKRFTANGNKQDQYVGMLGEVVVKRHFKIKSDPVEGWLQGQVYGFDGGYDFEYYGRKIDVKTMGRTVDPRPDFVNNFIAYQKNLQADTYIFTSLNKRTSELFILGWVSKDELLERGEKFKKGTERTRSDGSILKLKAPTFEIKNSDLNPMSTL